MRVTRIALASVGGLLALICFCSLLLDRLMSEAVVRGGFAPGFAAWDEGTFKAAFVESSAGAPAEGQGKTFIVAEGTRCRIIKEDQLVRCDGDYHAEQIQFIDGPHRSEVGWMCSDATRMLHPWP